MEIDLEPELSACIETKAKREYQKTLGKLLTETEDGNLEERLETLRLFLETVDFKRLREEYEKYLIAGRRVRFTLRLEKGEPRYEVTVT
jgi:hypothetical protein